MYERFERLQASLDVEGLCKQTKPPKTSVVSRVPPRTPLGELPNSLQIVRSCFMTLRTTAIFGEGCPARLAHSFLQLPHGVTGQCRKTMKCSHRVLPPSAANAPELIGDIGNYASHGTGFSLHFRVHATLQIKNNNTRPILETFSRFELDDEVYIKVQIVEVGALRDRPSPQNHRKSHVVQYAS